MLRPAPRRRRAGWTFSARGWGECLDDWQRQAGRALHFIPELAGGKAIVAGLSGEHDEGFGAEGEDTVER